MRKEKQGKPMLIPPPLNVGFPIVADPLGMYTGLASDPEDTPVQDADDL